MRDYQTKQNAGALPDSITVGKYGAGEFNSLAGENEVAVSSSGQTLAPADGTGEVLDQLSMALAIYGAGGAEYCIDTGAVNAYVIAPVSPKKAAPAYFDGMTLSFKPGNGNTSAATVNYASLGVKSITTAGGLSLSGGEILDHFTIRYNLSGDRFEIISTGSNLFARSIIDGLILSNGTDTDHDIDIAIGVAGLFNGTAFKIFNLNTVLTKQIDVNWAEGDDDGGFPSGLTLAADTEYNFFLIGKDDGTVDAGFDTSLTAVNLLADATGYDWYRRICSVFTDGSSNILGFYFEPDTDFFRFNTAITDVNDSTLVQNVYETGTATIPASKTGKFEVISTSLNEDSLSRLRSTGDDFDSQAASFNQTTATEPSIVGAHNIVDFPVDGSSQFEYAITNISPDNILIKTLGWFDRRQ